MRNIFCGVLVIILSGCASTGINQVSKQTSTNSSQRMPSSDQALSVEGDWVGNARITNYRSPNYPLVCTKAIIHAVATGQPCERYSTSGISIEIKLSCSDDFLSPKGQAIFSQSVQLCQTSEQLKRYDGFSTWSTLIGPDTRIKDTYLGSVSATVSESDSKQWQGADVPTTAKVIRFSYSRVTDDASNSR